MNDTVKIERPMCCRRHEDLGGRIKQDSRGKPTRIKTRVHDSQDNVAVCRLNEGRDLHTE